MIARTTSRAGAWLIDMGILLVAAWTIAVALGAGRSFQTGSSAGAYVESSSWLPLLLACSLIYAVPLWVLRGATIGQQALGLRVYRATRPAPLDWLHAAVRWLGPFGWLLFAVASLASGQWVNVMLLVLLGVAVSVGRDPQCRYVHDRLAVTLVVQTVSPWSRPQ